MVDPLDEIHGERSPGIARCGYCPPAHVTMKVTTCSQVMTCRRCRELTEWLERREELYRGED